MKSVSKVAITKAVKKVESLRQSTRFRLNEFQNNIYANKVIHKLNKK